MRNDVFYIWFQMCVGLYSRLTSEVFSRFSSIEEVYDCTDFSFLGEKRQKYINRLEIKDTSAAFEIKKRCDSIGAEITGFYDERYPKKLRDIDNPPAALYSIGEFKDLNNNPCVGIVGTRNMSDYGKEITETFAYNFAKCGSFIISGLAKGIDTAAHRGCVMAGGYTVGVLGNPIGDIYPKENIKAFETLYKQGLVISELYPGAPRTKADFPNRNRIISGISDAVIISEAGEGSGALITARHAISQGKAIYAIMGAIGSGNEGTNRLIKQGVPAITSHTDVLPSLTLQYPESAKAYELASVQRLRAYGNSANSESKPKQSVERVVKKESKPKHEPIKEVVTQKQEEFVPESNTLNEKSKLSGTSAERILAVLKGPKPITADEISMITGIPITEVMTELTFMEIDGSIISSVGGRYISAKF